ncbi:hypothetical protein, partial [Caldibacillus thermoamylovorans]|uniref:hypothetical protein n=2 Tax=Bacillaceae TaxID=186817 RepID=UPI0013791786
VTKTSLVAKIEAFSPQNSDENESRRQKQAFLNQKWRRKQVSSSKTGFSQPKVVTKTSLVPKNKHFTPQNGDEIEARAKRMFFALKWISK